MCWEFLRLSSYTLACSFFSPSLTVGTADFVYPDFNFTHGLTFVGASATTACINITELNYGNVQGDADQLQGSLDTTTKEAGEEVVTENVKTSEVGEHERIAPNLV